MLVIPFLTATNLGESIIRNIAGDLKSLIVVLAILKLIGIFGFITIIVGLFK